MMPPLVDWIGATEWRRGNTRGSFPYESPASDALANGQVRRHCGH